MKKSEKWLVLLAFVPALLWGQKSEPTEKDIRLMVEKESEQKLVVQNTVLMQEGYSYYAEIIADKLLTLQPENPNYNYRKGFAVIDGRKNAKEALPYLVKALKNVNKDADMFSSKEQKAPADAHYYAGRAYHLLKEIDKAITHYLAFSTMADPNSALMPLSRLKLRQCEIAKKELANPKSAKVVNIGDRINTKSPEYSPVVSLDGSALYFTSRRMWDNNETEAFRDARFNQYPEDIYVSYMDFDGTWMEPYKLEFNQPERNEATMSVSADERRIYVYQDRVGTGDIFYSDFSKNRFEEIKPLKGNGINSPYWEPHCFVTVDGLQLYFVSDRPGGFGGRDIYRCRRLPDMSWSEPINLGPSINTPFDEDAPFMGIDNKTLYFSSNGPLSMGDFDIFVSQRDADYNWSPPINLGYPINSTGDDIYYTTTVDGLRGFMSSHRQEGEGEKDIFEIKNDYLGMNSVAVLKGQIKTVNDQPIPEDVAIRMTCLDCATQDPVIVYPRLRDGIYFATLEPCHEYDLEYVYQGGKKLIYSEDVKTACGDNFEEIMRDILIDLSDSTRISFIPKEEKEDTKIASRPRVIDNSNLVTDKKKVLDTPPVTTHKEIEKKEKPKVIPKETKKEVPTKEVKELDPVVAKDFKNEKYKYYFKYNGNKINPRRGDFKKFVRNIERQMAEGRENIAINIYASASKVPTYTFDSNAKLSNLRAENIKYDLITYFQENSPYKDRIVVTILRSEVAGPDYADDPENKEKYRPYQYVEVITE